VRVRIRVCVCVCVLCVVFGDEIQKIPLRFTERERERERERVQVRVCVCVRVFVQFWRRNPEDTLALLCVCVSESVCDCS